MNLYARLHRLTRVAPWLLAIAGLVGITCGGWSAWTFTKRQPPVVIVDAREVYATSAADGDMNYIVTKLTNELCRTRAARWLWRWDPTDPRPIPAASDPNAFRLHRPQFREINSTPDAPPVEGPQVTYRLSVPIRLEDHVEPGDWYPVSVSSDECSTSSRPLRFTAMMTAHPIHVDANRNVTPASTTGDNP